MENFEAVKLELLSKNIPCYIFWKDKNLTYQGGNEYFLKAIGLTSSTEISNKTDYDLPWEAHADLYRNSDLLILEGDSLLNSRELRWHANEGTRYIIVNKLPLKDEKGNINGILCIHQDITWQKSENPINSISHSEIELLDTLRNILNIPFTHREIECLSLWLSGYSIKESSACLHISEKSIEAYRKHIKDKTNVYHKYQLIDLMESQGIFHLFLALAKFITNKTKK